MKRLMARLTRDFWVRAFLAVILTEATLLGVVVGFRLELTRAGDLTVFTTVPLFVLTLIELRRTLGARRADLIKEWVSEFFLKPELYMTFHELIYTYRNEIFDKMERIRSEQDLDNKPRPVFGPFDSLQEGREAGSRFYHPDLFQRSPEERRLDTLLGYLDVIGYYHHRGLIPIEDIVGSLGFYLALMRNRKAVMRYLEGNKHAWETNQYFQAYGYVPPFAYLHRLLEDVHAFNEMWGRVRKEDVYRSI
jgi:hypothetical protein